MRRLAIFWLACAAIGFLAAIGAACVLSLAVDGAASWRAERPAQTLPQHGAAKPPGGAPTGGSQPIVASAIGANAGS